MPDTLVLCYHAVSPGWAAALSVRPDALRDQLGLLRRRGYRGVTFTEAVAAPAPHPRVAVTFDDAFASVRELAEPILDALGWPGTVFAVSDHVQDGRPLTWDGTSQWLATEDAGELAGLDLDGLRALRDAGWEIGSHTASHPHLPQLADDALEHELAASRTALEAGLGRPCESLAYPYGEADGRVVAAARAAGYRWATTLPARWPGPQPLLWPRAGVYQADDLRRFRLKVSPAARRVRRMLRR